MEKEVYVVSYTSYDDSDGNLYQEQEAFANEKQALERYNSNVCAAKADAANPYDDEDDMFNCNFNEYESDGMKSFEASRTEGDFFRVVVKMTKHVINIFEIC